MKKNRFSDEFVVMVLAVGLLSQILSACKVGNVSSFQIDLGLDQKCVASVEHTHFREFGHPAAFTFGGGGHKYQLEVRCGNTIRCKWVGTGFPFLFRYDGAVPVVVSYDREQGKESVFRYFRLEGKWVEKPLSTLPKKLAIGNIGDREAFGSLSPDNEEFLHSFTAHLWATLLSNTKIVQKSWDDEGEAVRKFYKQYIVGE